MEKKLYRDTKNEMVAGVCAGLGNYFEVDPTLIRLAFALAVLAGFGSGIPLYILLAIIMPEGPVTDADRVERSIKELDRDYPEQSVMHETPVAPPTERVRNNDGS
jgi:phage shock protein C